MRVIQRILAAVLLIALAVAVIAIGSGPGRAELIDAEPPPLQMDLPEQPLPAKGKLSGRTSENDREDHARKAAEQVG